MNKRLSVGTLERTQSLTDLAYAHLEELIVTLKLAPGAVVSESDLSELTGIGRTPIREALQRLAREKLVSILPRRGIVVTEINVGNQLRLLEVRRELERLMASLAAERATPEERREFAEVAAAMLAAAAKGDDIAFMRLDQRFNVDAIGTQPAALTTWVAATRSQPRLIINAGTAGGFAQHGAAIGDIGVSPAVDAVAYGMQPGAVSDPITTDNGTVIVKMLERQDPPATDVATGKATLKTELVNLRAIGLAGYVEGHRVDDDPRCFRVGAGREKARIHRGIPLGAGSRRNAKTALPDITRTAIV